MEWSELDDAGHMDLMSLDGADDLNDYYDEEYEYDEEEATASALTMSELLDQCVVPTLSQTVLTVAPLLGLCILHRVTSIVAMSVFSVDNARRLHHVTSAACGLWALQIFFHESLVYVVMLGLLGLLLLHATRRRAMSGTTVCLVTAVYLLTCELLVADSTEWHRIRGAQMVLAMKVISVAFDLQSGVLHDLPSVYEYCGYAFQVGSVIFGPWISFHEYLVWPQAKERKLDFYWVSKLVKSFVAMTCSVVMSGCVVYWFFVDGVFVWLVAFGDAQSFRFSHYFVSFLSQLTLTLSGLGASRNNGDVRWDLSVTKPLHVEFPRSIVEVVTNWNIPMHFWLKTYVFKTARPLGSLLALLFTYLASSLLHGLNFQLAAVLLSLGVYSYVEFVFRQRIASVFSACVASRRCKGDCEHRHKYSHPYVLAANMLFAVLTLFHLTYLGVMFDNSSQEETGYSSAHTLHKWAKLSYASHWLIAVMYVFYLLI